MNDLWISLSTYGGVTTHTALDVLWAAGVRRVELAIGVKPSADTVAVLRQYGEQGMQYRAHHALVWQEHRSFNLADTFDVEYFEQLTDWLAAMQITAYSVHAGRIDTAAPDAGIDRFLRHLEQLARLCRVRSIRLGVETMYPTPADHTQRYWLQSTVEIEQLLTAMPHVDLVIDLAHLNLWHGCSIREKLQVFQLAGNRLLELHISDNDGRRDNHTQICETTWWVPYFDAMPIEVPIVLESRMNHHTPQQVQYQVEHASRVLKASRPSAVAAKTEL